MQYKVAKTKVIRATLTNLHAFTRKELREYAKDLGVDMGRNKKDVIINLIVSGRATICASLGN